MLLSDTLDYAVVSYNLILVHNAFRKRIMNAIPFCVRGTCDRVDKCALFRVYIHGYSLFFISHTNSSKCTLNSITVCINVQNLICSEREFGKEKKLIIAKKPRTLVYDVQSERSIKKYFYSTTVVPISKFAEKMKIISFRVFSLVSRMLCIRLDLYYLRPGAAITNFIKKKKPNKLKYYWYSLNA